MNCEKFINGHLFIYCMARFYVVYLNEVLEDLKLDGRKKKPALLEKTIVRHEAVCGIVEYLEQYTILRDSNPIECIASEYARVSEEYVKEGSLSFSRPADFIRNRYTPGSLYKVYLFPEDKQMEFLRHVKESDAMRHQDNP